VVQSSEEQKICSQTDLVEKLASTPGNEHMENPLSILRDSNYTYYIWLYEDKVK
jgi:hypothetical protein